MDTKKAIETLIKIAERQQKIILKLAQAQGLPPDALPNSQVSVTDNQQPKPSTDTPPAELKPASPSKVPSKLLFDTVNAKMPGVLRHVNPPRGNEMQLVFAPGKLTQSNYDSILKVYQGLLNSNQIMTNYKLTYAQG